MTNSVAAAISATISATLRRPVGLPMQAMAEFPALAGLLVPGGESAGGPDSFPPEIEEEANNNFQASPAGGCVHEPSHSIEVSQPRGPQCVCSMKLEYGSGSANLVHLVCCHACQVALAPVASTSTAMS
jgi:hypothetical protein